jgi:hypothetical protein
METAQYSRLTTQKIVTHPMLKAPLGQQREGVCTRDPIRSYTLESKSPGYRYPIRYVEITAVQDVAVGIIVTGPNRRVSCQEVHDVTPTTTDERLNESEKGFRSDRVDANPVDEPILWRPKTGVRRGLPHIRTDIDAQYAPFLEAMAGRVLARMNRSNERAQFSM